MDISGNLILVKFGGISGLVESSRFFKQGVDIGRNLRLMDSGGFSKF